MGLYHLVGGVMIYGSVCSGIEAATAAWHGLGWQPSFFSEIDPFPRAVLKHHYPEVPLHGDFTTIENGQYRAIDLLVGGTPCQSFSIAGLRGGLGDDRGNLALEYLKLADRLRPRWLVWENVPGVFSSLSHAAPDPCPPPPPVDLGCDGATMETEDEYDSEEVHALQCFLAGFSELGYGFAYRVLNAEVTRTRSHPFAVPQRRRRVFVVGHLGDCRRAAAVLFDRESMSGNPAPRREAGQNVAPTLSARPSAGGGLGTDFDLDGGLVAFGGNRTSGPIDVSPALNAHPGGSRRCDFEREALIAFDCKGTQVQFSEAGEAPTLRSMSHAKPHQNAGGQIAIAIQERAVSENPSSGPDGAGVRDDGVAYTLEARTTTQAVAFDLRGREGGAQFEGPHNTANLRAASGGSSRSYVADSFAVRRLTPRECDRLQGFEDDYTNIPWRGKDHAPDGHRYKALGNSMAVNVMRWIGERIDLVEGIDG